MEVREPSAAYLVTSPSKRTELGSLPNDWHVESIGELHPFVTSGSRGWAQFYAETGAPFVRITNLSRTCIYPDLADLRYVRLPSNDSEGARTQLAPGDVLISITADIGVVGFVAEHVPTPAYINQHIALVRFDSTQTCARFVSYFLASEVAQKRFRSLTDAGAKAGMNLATVRAVQVALPPTLAEQKAIASALSDGDALIESLEQLLAKKRQIKQGAMQELLTGQRRLPGFGGARKRVRMREVLSQPATYGIVTAGAFVQQGVKMLRGGDISDGRVNVELPMVTQDKADEYLRTKLRAGDVVIALVGYPGESARVPEELAGSNISRAVGLLRTNREIDGVYLSHLLNSPNGRQMVLAPSAGSAQQVVNLAALNKLEFSIPPIEEQAAIAQVLSDMDTELTALEARLAKARALKQGMAQALLTGRIRLV